MSNDPHMAGMVRISMLKGVLWALHRTFPIVLYQLVVLIRHPSWLSAGMVILSLLLNQAAIAIVILYRIVKSRRNLIEGCLDRMRDCTFTRYPVSRFLDAATHGAIENSMFRNSTGVRGMIKAPLDEMIHLYVVTSTALVSQLSCYSAPTFVDSHIFISDPPENMGRMQRFFVLHEIGHTQTTLFVSPAFMRLWIWPYIWLILWALLTATWHAGTLIIVGAYMCATLLWWEEWNRRTGDQRMASEILADAFALSYLPADDLVRIATNKRLSELLDGDMGNLQNTVRLALLRENIELTRHGGPDAVMSRAVSSVPEPEWKAVLGGMGLVMLMGFTGTPPEGRTVMWAAGSGAVLVAGWIYLMLRIVSLDRTISTRVGSVQAAGGDDAN
jgi:hypothetical protein